MKYTEIIFILDASGSMAHLADDTIGGFNGFIKSQQALEGKANLTTILFDTTWRMLHDGVDLQQVKPLTREDYVTGGWTAMLDAIGEVINKVQDRHDTLGSEKPEEVLCVITTDGEENSSKKFTKSQIEKMIKHQTNGHGWKFMFLGANMDAVKEAESIGISSNYSTNYEYTSKGISDTWTTLNCATSSVRTATLDSAFNLTDSYTAIANDTAINDINEALSSINN